MSPKSHSHEQDLEQGRRALSNELDGLGGLVYRISTTLDPNGMHAASLSVVCEAISLARQAMADDRVETHDTEDLTVAIKDLLKKASQWKVAALHKQVWVVLPDHMKPGPGPTLTAVEYALDEWLARAETEGKSAGELAEEFIEFCQTPKK